VSPPPRLHRYHLLFRRPACCPPPQPEVQPYLQAFSPPLPFASMPALFFFFTLFPFFFAFPCGRRGLPDPQDDFAFCFSLPFTQPFIRFYARHPPPCPKACLLGVRRTFFLFFFRVRQTFFTLFFPFFGRSPTSDTFPAALSFCFTGPVFFPPGSPRLSPRSPDSLFAGPIFSIGDGVDLFFSRDPTVVSHAPPRQWCENPAPPWDQHCRSLLVRSPLTAPPPRASRRQFFFFPFKKSLNV